MRGLLEEANQQFDKMIERFGLVEYNDIWQRCSWFSSIWFRLKKPTELSYINFVKY